MVRWGIDAQPPRGDFAAICATARAHLADGEPLNRLPHSNQLWMLVGFALFEKLERRYECLEVFPQATIRGLGIEGKHKTKREGLRRQIAAVAAHTGWVSAAPLHTALKSGGYGALHDRLDAFMCAWVASLPARRREAHGKPPRDVIWTPA
jgi:hypothetical protein